MEKATIESVCGTWALHVRRWTGQDIFSRFIDTFAKWREVNGQEDAVPRAVNNATTEYDGELPDLGTLSALTESGRRDKLCALLALKLVQSLCGREYSGRRLVRSAVYDLEMGVLLM